MKTKTKRSSVSGYYAPAKPHYSWRRGSSRLKLRSVRQSGPAQDKGLTSSHGSPFFMLGAGGKIEGAGVRPTLLH